MSLKRSYTTEAEVPTEHKADYVPKGGRYVLDVEGFDNIDSVLAKNSELLGTHTTDRAEITRLTGEVTRLGSELTAAQASALPRGKRAVDIADAELADAVKAKGVTTAEAFNALHKEHGEYKTTAEEATATKHAAEVAVAMGWDKDKAARLVPKHYDLSTVELRDGKDGKKEAVAKVKQADGTTFVEKPFADVVKATPELLDLTPLLTGKTGPVIATQGVGDPPDGKSGVDSYIASTYSAPKPRNASA